MMGLYAVMAYSVIERNREFAVRMALGSSRSGIFRLVLQGSASVILVGLVVGGAGSIAGVRLLRSMLFNVAPFDPISFSAGGRCAGHDGAAGRHHACAPRCQH